MQLDAALDAEEITQSQFNTLNNFVSNKRATLELGADLREWLSVIDAEDTVAGLQSLTDELEGLKTSTSNLQPSFFGAVDSLNVGLTGLEIDSLLAIVAAKRAVLTYSGAAGSYADRITDAQLNFGDLRESIELALTAGEINQAEHDALQQYWTVRRGLLVSTGIYWARFIDEAVTKGALDSVASEVTLALGAGLLNQVQSNQLQALIAAKKAALDLPGAVIGFDSKAHSARSDAEFQVITREVSEALTAGDLTSAEAAKLNRFIASRREALQLPTLEVAHKNDPGKQYSPLYANLTQFWGPNGESSGTGAGTANLTNPKVLGDEGEELQVQITNIRRSTDGTGYDITYRFRETAPGEPLSWATFTATILPEDCRANTCLVPFDKSNPTWDENDVADWGRAEYFLWWQDGAAGSEATPLSGPPENPWLDYLNVLHFEVFVNDDESNVRSYNRGAAARNWVIHGTDTPAGAMPYLGSATYYGFFRADALRKNSIEFDFRQRYQSSDVTLTVDFDTGALTGGIENIRISPPGMSHIGDRAPRPSSSFSINGRIDGNGFTATLTGSDSDPNVPDARSVRGFTGEIDGRFFGPTGEEFGGALNAERDLAGEANDLNMYGYVVGQRWPE